MPWDPDRYHHFKSERAAPFADLRALVEPRPNMKVIDLGCGTGELTSRLADYLPGSDVLGIDSSPEMLARAEEHTRPGLRFELRRVQEVEGDWDLVFSHATLQWVEDHEQLIPWLFSITKPGGQIAVQMPSNHDHATHSLIREIASMEPFRSALGGWNRESPVLAIEQYAEMLYRSGGRDIAVYEKVYPHVLDNSDALADWTSGTALVPYFERLSAPLQEEFMEVYRSRLRELYPEKPVFYGFKRTLFAAGKPGESRAESP